MQKPPDREVFMLLLFAIAVWTAGALWPAMTILATGALAIDALATAVASTLFFFTHIVKLVN